MQDIATQNPDKQKEMAKKLEEGKLSIRDWREQIQNVIGIKKISIPVLVARWVKLVCIVTLKCHNQGCSSKYVVLGWVPH